MRQSIEYTKQQIIEAVKVLEDLKFDVREKMYEMAKEQKGDPSLIVTSKVKAEELKKSDRLFEKTGIEEMDIEPNIERLGLRTDTDLTNGSSMYSNWQASG